MKICIGSKIQNGPWGGGNQFAINLSQFLQSRGHQVSFSLSDAKLDLILLTEPRTQLRISAFGSHGIKRYLLFKNPNAIVAHRVNVNEWDETKKTKNTNQMILSANRAADHTIFVSSWLKDLYASLGFDRPFSIIKNGPNTGIFNPTGHRPWDRRGPLKLVTHHWSPNWLKGFDIYQQVDELVDTPKYQGKIHFTYIGNLPNGLQLQHTTYYPPLLGQDLADRLRQCHVYLTASRIESGSNHQSEGACCGLPILYINSTSLPEYCEGFGIAFTPDSLEEKLDEMIDTYEQWVPRMVHFPLTADRMCAAYEQLFEELLDQREVIIARRTWMNDPREKFKAFMPNIPTEKIWQKTQKVLKQWTGSKN